jgi:hypothetical protein
MASWKLLDLLAIATPKASWGAVLKHLDKLCHRTEYKDLPNEVKPDIEASGTFCRICMQSSTLEE